MGIYSYHSLYRDHIQYTLAINNQTSIVADTDYYYLYVAYNYMVFEFIVCPEN